MGNGYDAGQVTIYKKDTQGNFLMKGGVYKHVAETFQEALQKYLNGGGEAGQEWMVVGDGIAQVFKLEAVQNFRIVRQ